MQGCVLEDLNDFFFNIYRKIFKIFVEIFCKIYSIIYNKYILYIIL